MTEELYVYYDEEGDFLEINIGEHTKGFFRDKEEGIAERIDEETGKVTGIAILGFKKKAKTMQDMKVKLPFRVEVAN